MGIRDTLLAYDATVLTNVTEKSATDSIDPVDVGNIGTDLSAAIVDTLETINQEAISNGTDAPLDANGSDGDRYYQLTGGVIYEWRKTAGAWVNEATLSLGVTFPDGPLTNLRTSIDGMTATVTPGSWAISNVIYQKGTQTQFTVGAADANFLRYDLIYADENNDILYLAGTASSTPAFPTTPADTVVVDYVVVPSASSGIDPYMYYSGAGSTSLIPKTSFTTTAETTVLTWSSVISGETLTWAQKHGTSGIQVQAEDTLGNILIPMVQITRSSGLIQTVTISALETGSIITIL